MLYAVSSYAVRCVFVHCTLCLRTLYAVSSYAVRCAVSSYAVRCAVFVRCTLCLRTLYAVSSYAVRCVFVRCTLCCVFVRCTLCCLRTLCAVLCLRTLYAVLSSYAVRCDIFTKANSKLSSTRNAGQCTVRGSKLRTVSFKPVFLHFSYTPALHVLRDHT